MVTLGKIEPDFVITVGRNGHQTTRLVLQLQSRAKDDDARRQVQSDPLFDRRTESDRLTKAGAKPAALDPIHLNLHFSPLSQSFRPTSRRECRAAGPSPAWILPRRPRRRRSFSWKPIRRSWLRPLPGAPTLLRA